MGGKIEKTSPKWANLHKNMPKFRFAVSWTPKVPWTLKKKAIRKTKICKKQANLIETSPKSSNPQVFKQSARQIHQKTNLNSRENRKVGNTESAVGHKPVRQL